MFKKYLNVCNFCGKVRYIWAFL